MNGNLNLEMRLTANTGQLSNAFNTAGAHVRTFTSNVNGATQRMTAGLQKVYQQLNGFSTISRLAATAGGYSILSQALQRNLEFEKTLLDMKQTAEMTVAQAQEMRRLAIDSASASLATPTEMAAGLQKFASYGVKFESMRDMILESARAAIAFRSSVEGMATLDFNLQDKMKIDPSQMRDAHNILLYHAKSGNFDGPAMVNEAPKYLNSAATVGITGVGGLNLMGAITQVLMKYAPDTQKAEVSTLAGQGLGHLTTSHFYKKLEKNFGIDIKKYMPNGKFYGEGGAEGLLALAKEMKSKGLENPFNLDLAGVRDDYFKKFMMGIMKYADEIEAKTKIANARAKTDAVGGDNAEIMSSNYAKEKQFQITIEKGQLSDATTDLVGKYAALKGWAAENPGTAIAAGVGAAVGWRWIGKNMLGMFGGKGTPLEKALGAVGGAGMPVMVTNWPADLGGKMKASERLARLPAAASSAGSGAAGAAATSTAVGTAAVLGTTMIAAPLAVGYAFNKWQESESGRKASIRLWKLEGEQLDLRMNAAKSGGDTDLLGRLQKQRDILNNQIFAAAQTNGTVWKQELAQLDQRISAAKQTPDKELVTKLEMERADLASKLDGLIAELRTLASRPLQVNLDSRPLVDAVNSANGRDARRQ